MATNTGTSQAPLTPSTLLPTLQPHITSLTQSLPVLHHQLGLAPSALEADLVCLRDALLQAIENRLEERKREVTEWEERCRAVEIEVEHLRRKVGAWGKNIATGSVEENKILPRRFDLLTAQQDKLSALHAAKLEQLRTLSARLMALLPSLPPQFFPPACLNIGQLSAASGDEREDVTPERFNQLEKELVRGKGEVARRLSHLCHLFTELLYLHTELVLPFPSAPPTSIASPPMLSSRPDDANPISPSPISSDSPEAIFAQFIARLEEVETEGFEAEGELIGVEGVEPTAEVIEWAEQLKQSLDALKADREIRIQQTYDRLEALWRRLGVPEEEVDQFVEGNRGSGEDCVLAYEQELERMLELKRSKMTLFVVNAREEVRALWDDLMFGDEERETFAPFFDDDHTEELLARHEEEIDRLREVRAGKVGILTSVRKWFAICDEEKELEAAAQDGSRLLGRAPRGDPGRLLREEKMRKRVQKDKPKLEKELMEIVPAWEEEHGIHFLVHGARLMDLVRESSMAGEAQKENKRQRIKPALPPRATTPAVPTSRKRAATPSFTNPATSKRQRVDPPASAPGHARSGPTPSMSARPLQVATNVYETPAYAPLVPRNPKITPSVSKSVSSAVYGKLGHGVPPAAVSSGRMTSSASVFGSTRVVSSATEERIRASKTRSSFRPRPSALGLGLGLGLRAGAGAGRWEGEVVKEEDEDG